MRSAKPKAVEATGRPAKRVDFLCHCATGRWMDRSTALSRSNSLPRALSVFLRTFSVRPTKFILSVTIRTQEMDLHEKSTARNRSSLIPCYELKGRHRVSTSRFGVGQQVDSNRTPLGMHRIAAKIGGGEPVGTVFRGRRPIGLIWKGLTKAPIAHRILWLEGMQPGFNRGEGVDSYSRYIYVHGIADESTLGRPASRGCIHVSASDLIALFNFVPQGTLVWIER